MYILTTATFYFNAGLLTIIIVLCCIAIAKGVYWVIRQRFKVRIEKLYKASDIVITDFKANCLGRKSLGRFQRKGNGALVLTKTGIHFFQLSPNREILIPLNSVTNVYVVKTHLGKSIGFQLLHVSFTENDLPDSMAWYVTDLQIWMYELNNLLERNEKPRKNRFYIPSLDS